MRVAPIDAGHPLGVALTHDGKILIVADQDDVVFLDTGKLEGGSMPLLGRISDEKGAGSIAVSVTTDDRYLFVSEEAKQRITLIQLDKARRTGFTRDAIVGEIPVGRAPISLLLSPDGRKLYTTSQVAPASAGWPGRCVPEGRAGIGSGPVLPEGAVIVVDVEKAKTDPTHAVSAITPAGCAAARLALSPAADRIYVASRSGNALEVLSATAIESDPSHAKIASVPVGSMPVGVAVVDRGAKIVVANSNRIAHSSSDRQTLSVVDAAKVSQGTGAVLGSIPAGAFPRDLTVSPDGRALYVSNYSSNTLEIIDLGRLAAVMRK